MHLKKLFYTTVLALAIVACSKDDGPANSAPTIGAKTFTASEDIGDTKVIGTVTATDKDGDELSFSIGKNSGALFEITKDGALSLATGKGLDFETAASHSITVAVSDGSASASATITINVTDVDDDPNSAPVVVTEGFEVPEDIAGPIGTIEATDADNDPLEFGIKTDESGLFELSGAGELTLAEGKALDFETAQSHEILISVTDGQTSTEATITVTVTNVVESMLEDPTSFITTWKSFNPGSSTVTQITIPTEGVGYNYTLYWEEVGDPSHNGTQSDITGDITLEFGTSGTYRVAIQGSFPRIYFDEDEDNEKILSVDQWGTNLWTSMAQAFYLCTNLTIPATDIPDLSNVIDMSYMFAGASSFNGDISGWNVSSVTDMGYMFEEAAAFNQNIGNWDVSNVENMKGMFSGAASFDQNIGSWDVSSTTSTTQMFAGATKFNQDISNWNVSNVSTMGAMFEGAVAFNQNISNWDVSNVTSMAVMFKGATAFNQPLDWGEKTGNVTTMYGMFTNATAFSQDINNWNVSNVTDMQFMFQGATLFNKDVGGWDISSVANMTSMFDGAAAFNRSLGNWDISNVENMQNMLDNSGLTPTNFGATLIGWETQDPGEGPVPSFMVLGALNLQICQGTEAHDTVIALLGMHNWTINGFSFTNCNN